jgi:isoleucyl-tRNA synthetase
LQEGEPIAVTVDGEMVELLPEEVALEARPHEGYKVSEQGDYMVAVWTKLTDELIQEGLARELVRRIQNLRKEASFRIEEKIETYYQGDPDLIKVMREHGTYISQETLSLDIVESDGPEGSYSGSYQIDGKDITLHLVRASADG